MTKGGVVVAAAATVDVETRLEVETKADPEASSTEDDSDGMNLAVAKKKSDPALPEGRMISLQLLY